MIRALLAALLLLGGAQRAGAAEVRVLTAGAFRSVLAAVVPGFEQRTGDRVVILADTAGGVAGRVGSGEAFDLAILTPSTAEPLVRAGRLAPAVPVATVAIGVAAKAGAPPPDLSSVAAFKAALLAARAVAMVDPAAGGSSGIYMMGLFERMGILDAMRPKLVLVQGGLAAERVASGEAEIAIQQESELIQVKGVVLVGPIPEAVQSRTSYVAALNPAASGAASDLLAALTGPGTRALLPAKGMAAR